MVACGVNLWMISLRRGFGFKKPSYTEPLQGLMMTDHDLLLNIYNAFNRRDIETVLSALHPEVDWPNGMEGGRVYGREAVRQYWVRQWSQINPTVEPRSFHTDPTGATVVEVHQVIQDLSGTLLSKRIVQHVYRIENGLIRLMEIKEAGLTS
jgi:hypothetical protein